MNSELESAVKAFLTSLSSSCKDCLRHGSACDTCPCSTAAALLRRIELNPAALFEPVNSKSQRRKAAIIATVRRLGRCQASDIKLDCHNNTRSMILAKLVADGVLIKRNGRQRPTYELKG